MDFKDISPELREKAKACTSPEELLELAKREGYKLSEDELESVSGGNKRWRSNGDSREDVDPDLAHTDFVNGAVDGGEGW
jgi:predicted ribosomally synthesized peptide with nif11-like leader